MVTSAQLRAARGMLNWTVRDLASISGVHRNTVTRLEADGSIAGHALATVVATFERTGVIFIAEGDEGPGIRLKKNFDLGDAYFLAEAARMNDEPGHEVSVQENHDTHS